MSCRKNLCLLAIVSGLFGTMTGLTNSALATPFADDFSSDPFAANWIRGGTGTPATNVVWDSGNSEVDFISSANNQIVRQGNTVDNGEVARLDFRLNADEENFTTLGLVLAGNGDITGQRIPDMDNYVGILIRNQGGTGTEGTLRRSLIVSDAEITNESFATGFDFTVGTVYTFTIGRNGNDFNLAVYQGVTLLGSSTITNATLAGQTLRFVAGGYGSGVGAVEYAAITAVPEPTSFIILLFGFCGLWRFRRK
jgi:hypothetical protein